MDKCKDCDFIPRSKAEADNHAESENHEVLFGYGVYQGSGKPRAAPKVVTEAPKA